MSLAAGLALAACAPGDEDAAAPGAATTDRPRRIVSLDYCADQYVLKLADPGDILAISPNGTAPFSYLREEAKDVPTVRPTAEDVLLLKPDLVVRSYGGGPNAKAFFERAGVPVLQVGWAADVDGDGPASIPAIINDLARGLGQPERGRALVEDYRARLDAVPRFLGEPEALYMTPAGVTSGPGSLVHEMLTASGFQNFQTAQGWRPLPLERLAYERPNHVAAAFFDAPENSLYLWSAMRHPVAKAQLRELPVTDIKGAWTACGGWFLMDAIEALSVDAHAASKRMAETGEGEEKR